MAAFSCKDQEPRNQNLQKVWKYSVLHLQTILNATWPFYDPQIHMSSVQNSSKPLLVDDDNGLYYPIYVYIYIYMYTYT